MVRGLIVAGLVVLTGALVALVMVVLELRAATAPPEPQAFVNASWVVYKYGPGHRTHVGKVGLECKACHRTTAEAQFDRPGPAPCASCHEARGDIRHTMVALDESERVDTSGQGTPSLSNCLACHGFGPDPEQKPADCITCHERRQGELPAIVTHDDAPCTECHDVHENAVRPLACDACHTQQVQHAHLAAELATQCRDCHAVHAPAAFAEQSCAKCHGAEGEEPVPVTATFGTELGAHTCTGCHRPHDFQKSDALPCQSCHAELSVLTGHAEQGCTGCHDPHAARESVREGDPCVRCHSKIDLSHGPAAQTGSTRCTGCHAPHPSRDQASAAQTPCASCHAEIGLAGQTAHAGELACVRCHTPHAFDAVKLERALCTGCHAAESSALSTQKSHGECTSCHTSLPHGPTIGEKPCASCHEVEGREVRTGHATCTGCHDAHTSVVPGNRCESCHAQQARQHPRGHGDCTSCHDQHAGRLAPGVADCSGCHERARLPGLHQVAAHAPCQSCHEPHGTRPPAERAGCLSCHADRLDHEPNATQCSGCHAFIGPKPHKRTP